MINSFKEGFNLQAVFSYLGIFPFCFIILDIYLFNIFFINLLKDFIFFYSLIIFTFIGAIRWNFKNIASPYEIFFGFMPSLLGTFLIIIYLLNLDINFLLSIIVLCLILQLFIDYVFYKYNFNEKNFLLKVRIPVTAIIVFNIIHLISV